MRTPTYEAVVGTQRVELPVVEIADDLAIALLITVDLGVAFCARVGAELAELLAPLRVECVASIATMGIPVALEVSRAMGLDQYVVLHKTQKIHLRDAIVEPVRSITTDAEQRLLLDPARIPALAGRRVALVDDVVSTGGSCGAALRLLRRVGAEPVAIATIVTEGDAWRQGLGGDARLVTSLGELPLFRRDAGGAFVPSSVS